MQAHAQQRPHLLIDGYIATTFGSRDAEAYYSNLLKRPSRLLSPYNPPENPGVFFALSPLRPDLNPPPPQTNWLIDRVVRNGGTVIKQQIWVARNQNEFLRPPIFFVHNNGALGLSLNQARGGNCMSLRGAAYPAPFDARCGNHAQIRINVSFVYTSRLIYLKIPLLVARLSRIRRANFDSDPRASRGGNRPTREVRNARRTEGVQIHDSNCDHVSFS
jgi:hypothetical protein